ncbi:ester cyclase [Halorientalis marina]|uniref:ester cyclase n=1 Tax=Halorientalis marina TaxID=2931976 RepID=UPI001FF47CFC|nr:ester cyclase [Halorientalis marina]
MRSDTGSTDPAELVQRWFGELFNNGDLWVADTILAEEVRYEGPPSLSPGDVTGTDAIKEFVTVFRSAFPDLLYEVQSISAAHGELRVKWSATGTHEDDLFGMEPTGEVFTVEGINVFSVEDGLITAVHAQWDTLKMVQELGAVPSVGAVAE